MEASYGFSRVRIVPGAGFLTVWRPQAIHFMYSMNSSGWTIFGGYMENTPADSLWGAARIVVAMSIAYFVVQLYGSEEGAH